MDSEHGQPSAVSGTPPERVTDAASLASSIADVLGGEGDDDLATLVKEYTEGKEKHAREEKRLDGMKARIIAKMDELGTTSMKVAGRRIGFSTRTYYGVDVEKLDAFKPWMEKWAPEINIPASDKVCKAVEAYLAANPGQPLPDFIKSSETRSFTNAKA